MTVSANPYATPHADLNPPESRPAAFFVVAPRKFLLMVLLSHGLYTFYWMYKQWSTYRAATGTRVLPLVRAFFSIFFVYALVIKIKRALDVKELSYRWWPRCYALGWITTAFLPFTYIWFIAPFTALKLGVCLSIVQVSLGVQVQRAVNHLEDDPQGKANAGITWANGLWMALGVSFWVLGVSSALYSPL